MPRETLADLLLTGPLPPEHGARIGRDLAFALERAHLRGTWPAILRPDRIEVDLELRPVLTDLVEREPDVPALGVVLRALLGEGDPVPFVLQVIVMRARQGQYRSAQDVGQALQLWLSAQEDPPPARDRWLRLDPVRPALLAIGLVVVCLGATPIVRAAVEAPAPAVRSVVVPPGSWPAPQVPLEVEGVALSRDQAAALLDRVNGAAAEELRAVGWTGRAVEAVLAGRPFASVDALATAPGVGRRALERLRDLGSGGAE